MQFARSSELSDFAQVLLSSKCTCQYHFDSQTQWFAMTITLMEARGSLPGSEGQNKGSEGKTGIHKPPNILQCVNTQPLPIKS
jgi:hypothetical protein